MHYVRIRVATAAELSLLLPTDRGLTELAHQLAAWQLTDALKGERSSDRGEPTFGCVVAEAEHTLVGFAAYCVSQTIGGRKPTLHVNRVFVLSPYRRCGIATRLMHGLTREAVQRQCGPMTWHIPLGDLVAYRFASQFGAPTLGDPLAFSLSMHSVRWLAAVSLESSNCYVGG
jgi:GNAT superfamily N-acetyltransferase